MHTSLNACNQDQCKVSLTGKCLESIDLKDCPHFYLLSGDEEIETGKNTIILDEDPILTSKITLFKGEAFEIDNISNVTSNYPCKYIYILGGVDSGKTTLVATIFDLLQRGSIGNHIFFAGSLSLVGFEKRCYLSRTNSGADNAETNRTQFSDFKFLHLALKEKGKENLSAQHFLLSDISGELIEQSQNSSYNMEGMRVMKQPHRVVYVIDGERVANEKLRAAVIFEARIFIQKAIDSNIFSLYTDLHIVISKGDKFVGIDLDLEKQVYASLRAKFSAKVEKLTFSCIAARPAPHTPGFTFGQGVYQLLQDWMQPKSNAILTMHTPVITKSTRQFNKFKVGGLPYE